MKTGKQIWCFLLALALILGLFPTAAQPVQAMDNAGGATNLATATETAEANPVVRFTFAVVGGGGATEGIGSILVNGEDVGTETEVESGGDLKFQVKVPGYQINVVLLNGSQPLTADSNGEYTISGISQNRSVTIMVTKKDNVEITLEALNARIAIEGTDYTGKTYSARYNEEVTFSVETDADGATVTVEADNCSVTDHGDGTYTTSGITGATKITVTAEGGEERPQHTVRFQFSASECNGSILVDGIDCGTSVKVVSGRDLVFLVKVPGYRVNVVLLGGTQPISAASDGTYTIMNITKDYQVTIMVTKVSNLDVTFETIGTKVTVGGVDYSDNVYSAQYNEEITFRVVSELNNAPVTVTADQATITDHGDGTYTTSGITANTTITAQAEGAVKEPRRVTFRCTNAKVTINGEDYTGQVYPYLGGRFTFNVEIPEGYYVKAVTPSVGCEIINLSELKDGKTSYYLPEVGEELTITVEAEAGQENTWPLEYRYMYRGLGGSNAQIIACSPNYAGTLEIDYTVHNGVQFPIISIGDYAFGQCYKLTEVTMSDTVTDIGEGAFSYTGIRRIRLSENLRSMGEECFSTSIYLEELVIPEGVTTLRKRIFSRCSGLRSITLPDTLDTIQEYAFWECSALEEITIPAGVTAISPDTFSFCSSLKRVIFLGDVTSIGEDAFSHTALESIHLPDSLTSLGNGVFSFCYDESKPDSGLKEIVLPYGINKISSELFQGCKNLRSVTLLGDVTVIEAFAFENTALQSIDFPDSLVRIGDSAFRGTELTEIFIPRDCAEIGQYAFRETPVTAFQVAQENQVFMAGEDGVLFSKDGKGLVLYPYGRESKTYAVPAGVERIEKKAFYANPNLEEVTFPESLRDIGDQAFYRLPQLKRLTLPEGLEDITGTEVFAGCKTLRELKLPLTLKDISGDGVFYSIGITEMTLPGGMQDITGRDIFRCCESLTEVTFPSKMKKISGDCLFLGCTSLVEVVLPEKLEAISGSLIFASSGLEAVQFPASLKELGDATFEECTKLKEVHLPKDLQILGSSNFRGCTSLQKIVIPEGIEKLEDSTFYDCISLREIDIPAGVKQIGANCFAGCQKLSEVTLPESLEVLGSCAFGETGITQLHIPASLKYFGIAPIGVKREYGFWGYNTEQTCALYFTGDMPQWEDLSNAMPNLTSTYCYYPRENPTWTENLRDLLDGSGTYQIHWLATDVTLPESVELIAGFGKQLTAQVRPADDPNLALTWTSSDETVVQVDETGMCTGIAPGTAVITASAGGGAYSAQCQVTVLENSAPHYEDVPESAWYYEAVQYTSAHGLFQGMTETKFGPNLTMTRGMLVTVLYRMEGEPAVEGQTHPFTDVDASRYYGDAITWAANSGVVNGMTDTRFAPEAAVTREQMVTILYRYAKLKDADVTAKGDLESFPDHDQVKPYARDAFSWAVGAGIIQGDSNGSVATLSPRNSATRAQVAAVLMRYLEQLG